METVEAAGYRILELDHTAPVPIVGTPTVERVAHGSCAPPAVALRLPVPPRRDAAVISVVIPVKNGGADLARCLAGIAAQAIDEPVEIVVVDSGSTDGSADRARAAGAVVHEIPAERVRARPHAEPRRRARLGRACRLHLAGRRRGRRRLARATRGGRPALARRRRARTAGNCRIPAHGHRRCSSSTSCTARRSARRGSSAEDELTFETTLFSNVNAAIPRAVLERFPFRDDLTMSEDQEWSRRALRAGYALVYEPRAVVRHSHAYTVAHGVPPVLRLGHLGRALVRRGRRVAGRPPPRRRALRPGGARVAVEDAVGAAGSRTRSSTSSAKFAGLQLGLRHERLPRSLVSRLSGLPARGTPTAGPTRRRVSLSAPAAAERRPGRSFATTVVPPSLVSRSGAHSGSATA